MDIVLWGSSILVGLLMLIVFGDKLSDKIVEVAEKAGVSPLIISLVIISLATTLPEITTSAMASLSGSEGIALGNALGSIFANIALILGLASMIKPIQSNEEAFENSIVMLLSLLFLLLLSMDGQLSRLDGLVLLTSYFIYLRWLYKRHVVGVVSGREERHVRATPLDYLLLFILGTLMVVGARLVVYGGRNIAESLGISEYVIGATIVAVGTSLPEMTNALYGAIRGRGSISIGNIIGANIMNALVVLGIASLIQPLLTGDATTTVIFVLLAMVPLIISLRVRRGVNRPLGAYFLVLYFLYLYTVL